MRFWILQYIFIVKLSMSSLKKIVLFGMKKNYSLLSNNPHPTHLLARVFFKFCYSVSGKTFFKKGIYVLFFLYVKKNGKFLHFSVLFFTGLLLSILYKQLAYKFQFSAVLACPFGYFSTIC